MSGNSAETWVCSAEDAQAQVALLADQWAEAVVSNDADRIAPYLADDWAVVSGTGVTAREEFLGLVRSGELSHSAMTLVSPVRVRAWGATATFTARVSSTTYLRGERHDTTTWSTDVFVRHDGAWRCVLSQTTPATTPVPPAAP
ncbi:nuclear transport factor 2 family protein [Streptomyces sp. JJ66]|uniref:nuclear transport factor 2 family protein n=1 Tax=Streptomyces sp. JJ66 TaxID=2803843 RepID=UPI001C59AEA7|nr:nuclear transport factor 2 family protein [Streptomyces sp. JJ66]MBW1603919.1 nuclear transport factor 2 family protein [Streptomyces sp. JJ66]